jgi:hypothetical protein
LDEFEKGVVFPVIFDQQNINFHQQNRSLKNTEEKGPMIILKLLTVSFYEMPMILSTLRFHEVEKVVWIFGDFCLTRYKLLSRITTFKKY